MKRLLILFTALLISLSLHAQTVGLVLSGGGAKGIAHVGLIKALEENNIPIDYITGTSMGSIVGALYAMGYTPDEMLEIMTSQEFLDWAFGNVPKEDIYYFLQPEHTPEIVTINLGQRQEENISSNKIVNNIVPGSVINPLPMNYAIMELFDPYTAQCDGDFDKLFVPYRAIASNVNKKRKEVLRSGNLGDAVRASMTIPIAYKPITINGDVMYDGGIYDNFPVQPMEEEFHPDFIIGSRLASSDTTEVPLHEKNILSQLLSFVMQENTYTIAPEKGIVVMCPTQGFSMFDFADAQAIYERGYKIGIEMADSIKSRVPREVSAETRHMQRQLFKSRTPRMLFSKDITVTGVDESEKEYIMRQFSSSDSVLTIEAVHNGYLRNISTEKLSDLRIHARYNPDTKLYDLHLNAKSREGFSIGIGGFISSQNANSIYLGGHYRTLRLNSFDFDAGIYLGQNYQAGTISARMDVGKNTPTYMRLHIVSQQQYYSERARPFYDFNTPRYITNNENYAKLSVGFPITKRTKLEVTGGYAYIVDRYFQQLSNLRDRRDESKYSLGQLSARVEANWLDNQTFPTQGGHFYLSASYIYGSEKDIPAYMIPTDEKYIHNYYQLKALGHYYFNFDVPISLGLKGEVCYNNNTFSNNYTATMIQAPAFVPTPSMVNNFDSGLRANQYVAVGVIPIWKIINGLQLRTEFYGFAPLRPIKKDSDNMAYYGKPFENITFFGEASLVYNLPWASVSLYGNYRNIPAPQWGFGITLGVQLFAPKFIL